MEDLKRPLKLAFIGGSVDSAVGYTHYIASKMDNLFTVNAGCFSRNDAINKKTAITWGIEEKHVYNTWESLLKNEINNVDALVVLTPTPNH